MVPRSVAVLEYHLVGYRRSWHSLIAASLTMPLLFLLGIGGALGAYVDRSGTLPVPYLQYIAPGLLASGSLRLAMTESGAPVLSRFKWLRTYYAMGSAPLRPADMILGELAFMAVRVAVTATAFVLVMLPFGIVGSAWAAATPLIAVLLGLAVAAPMIAFSASVNGSGSVTTMLRFGMLPMILFSGVFFPVSQLPAVLRAVAYALPLWHGVELCRAATLGLPAAWPPAAHLAVLAAWFVGGRTLARYRFSKRLTA